MKRRHWIVASLGAFVVCSGLFYLWFQFHSIPTQSDLQTALGRADAVELISFVGSKPDQYVKLQGADRAWDAWIDKLRFQSRFWGFGAPPGDSWLIQTFVGKVRTGAFEVRADNCLYVRKAVRWYRMPVDADFGVAIRGVFTKQGQPVPDETKRAFDYNARQ